MASLTSWARTNPCAASPLRNLARRAPSPRSPAAEPERDPECCQTRRRLCLALRSQQHAGVGCLLGQLQPVHPVEHLPKEVNNRAREEINNMTARGLPSNLQSKSEFTLSSYSSKKASRSAGRGCFDRKMARTPRVARKSCSSLAHRVCSTEYRYSSALRVPGVVAADSETEI